LRQIATHHDRIFALAVSGWVVPTPDANALESRPFVKSQSAEIGWPNLKHHCINAPAPQHP
jgi:hypothetical protein